MKKQFLLFLISIITMTAFGQTTTEQTTFNFGFENTTYGQKLPNKWFQWGSYYNLSIDSLVKHGGKNSVLIQPSENRTSSSFGCIAYKIPAAYKAKEIELKAYMKMKDVKDGFAGLLLRIDGESGSLAFDNMQKKNLQGTSDWALYSVKLSYPKGAKKIFIGALLTGTGQIWVDDFELLIDGNEIEHVKQTKAQEYKADKDNEFDNGSKIDAINLSEEKINDLKILGLVWGFLKYYHPNTAAGNYNWDYELFRILPTYTASNSPIIRDSILSAWIKSLDSFEENTRTKKNKGKIKFSADLGWITNSNLSKELTAQLINVEKAKRDRENYYIDLERGVENPVIKNEKAYSAMNYPDAGFRLLSLYRYWNIIQYYYPYKNLFEEDWKNILKEFIPKYINASNEIEYKLVVLELIGRIHDTHANIWNQDEALNKYWGVNYAPVEIKFVESKAVVSAYYDQDFGEKSGLQIGDMITSINNKSVKDIVVERLKYTPASNLPTQLRDLAENLLRTNDTVLTIKYTRDGLSETKDIKVFSTDKINIYKKYQIKDSCFKFINPDIAYIYPGTLKNDYLPVIMKAIKSTKGLIIDFRCYPSDFIVFSLGKYLFPKRTAFVKFSNGSITDPGNFTMTNILKVGMKNKDYYKGKVIILVNESTQSQAEYTTMAFRAAPKAIVIGSTTAGADGNVSPIILPGGINTMISGIGVYYPDGKETQRIGIVPDIEVKPTIEGIKNHKDEVLERALQYIKTGK
jgi:C-terminal processing protease CtpA/Prc